MRMRRPSWRRLVTAVLIASAIGPAPAFAQLNTQHMRGLVGLKAGSQPPPHIYVIAPVLYWYNTDDVRDRNGEKLPIDADITTQAFGAGFNWVTKKKILGANYGMEVLFPLGMNNRIQGTEIEANPGAGLTDTLIEPLQLGWHFARADAIASYAIFVPTGRYTDGAANNTGLGMWAQEMSFGTTVYLNEAKQYHAAALVSVDFQSKKEDSETKVGNAMNIEGGVGADLMQGGLTIGLNYFSLFKLTRDRIDGFPQILIRGKNRVFGLGPEVSLALARKGVLYGFIKVNYMWEAYARTNTKGSELTILTTLMVKPLRLPAK
jgi:hypothetical protein